MTGLWLYSSGDACAVHWPHAWMRLARARPRYGYARVWQGTKVRVSETHGESELHLC